MRTSEDNDKTLFFDGCDSAIVGFISRCGQVPVVVYGYRELVRVFERQGMTSDEAEEWVAFNCEGAWVGEGTPGILHRARAATVRETIQQ